MPFSIRFDRETETRLRRLIAETGRSRAWVVREAVAQYAAPHDASAKRETAYDRLKPYIGTLDSGGKHYSVDTHRKYRASLQRKHGRETRSR